MIRTVTIVILAITTLGLGYFAYNEHQEKKAIAIQSENNYQRAFHELNYNMDALHDKIGETLAMNSKKQLSPALVHVWRLTSEAHNNVGQLPLALLPFNKTEAFLNDIGEFSYRVSVRDLEKKPLTSKEHQTLSKLYHNAENIQNELRRTEAIAAKKKLKWSDVQVALAKKDQPSDNTIIDGFKTVDKSSEGYSDTDFGPEVTSINNASKRSFRHLKGKEISKQEAIARAVTFFQLKKNVKISVKASGKGSVYKAYSLTIYNPDTKATTYMDVTKKGGYPLWVLQDRSVAKAKLSLNDAEKEAAQFLKKHMKQKLLPVSSQQYDNIAVFTFVGQQKGVRIYPEHVTVKVALDNGDIMGYQGTDFLVAHHHRNIPKEKISEAQARKKLSKKFHVKETHRAIVINDIKQEVSCYEFIGTLGQETYVIYLSTEDGSEELVKKLKESEPNYEAL
ncbi:Putative metallopeptidase YpeB [Fictibacillus macauensis ZFHKF-1]|uniref:Putative metallopeptidase YpeB n=1 Tax=Fictibacillus macauensis ZFHKF-1 TaxID=1196324 RepID=I8UI54_9BACL|nr:germination protein YpeB [Fictibacillus macauensis]EIT86570.1 Putative metallopeptidase YpeB [Fictibacillus macauensis ZFHKF-1]